MDFVGLVSGGKDSIYSICKLIDEGNRLVGLVHMSSNEAYTDSYMYQTVGSEVAQLLGKCFRVPMYVFITNCNAKNLDLNYDTICDGDEVEDLYHAIKTVGSELKFQALSSGAILSKYQKNRVEYVCKKLNLISLAPIWERDQKELLNEMIEYGIDARIVKIASSGLEKKCLNMSLPELNNYMGTQNYKYETNYCGEGGEYETLVFDCKFFKERIVYGSVDILSHPDEKGRPNGVYYCFFKDLSTIPKIK